MKRGRSLIIMIVVPAVVSLAVTLTALTIWDAQKQSDQRVIVLPTDSGTALIPARPTQLGSGSSDGSGVTGQPDATEAPGQASGAGCENTTHAVVAGDTLLGISAQYGVSVDDLIAINRVADPTFDPDLLSVGQTLVIPVCGVPTATDSPTPADTLIPTRDIPTPVATATEPAPGAISVKVSRVLDIGDITREAVEIVNAGSTANLEKWTLTDGKGHTYKFPAFSLFKGGGVTVYSGVGQDTPIKLYWGLDSPLWEIGDSIYLYDADGSLEDKFDIAKQ